MMKENDITYHFQHCQTHTNAWNSHKHKFSHLVGCCKWKWSVLETNQKYITLSLPLLCLNKMVGHFTSFTYQKSIIWITLNCSMISFFWSEYWRHILLFTFLSSKTTSSSDTTTFKAKPNVTKMTKNLFSPILYLSQVFALKYSLQKILSQSQILSISKKPLSQ